jgi:hypothetical protein
MITNNEIRNDLHLCCKLPIELVNIIISYIPRPNYINEIKETRIALINEYNDSLIDSDDELDIMEGLDEDYDMYSDEMSFFRLLLWSKNVNIIKSYFFDYGEEGNPDIRNDNYHIYTDYFNIYKNGYDYDDLDFQDLSDAEINDYLIWETSPIDYMLMGCMWAPDAPIPYLKPIPKEQIDKYYERLEYKTKIEPWEDYW